MTVRGAIHILMLSPIYFRLPPSIRLQLAKEYCRGFNALAETV